MCLKARDLANRKHPKKMLIKTRLEVFRYEPQFGWYIALDIPIMKNREIHKKAL
jgi:hypothetical protein